MAKEYIERAAIVGDITNNNMQANLRQMTGSEAYAQILSILNCTPAADVVEVVHGRWAENQHDSYDDDMLEEYVRWYTYTCSECGGEVMKDYRYCPNCGARMDGDSDA